MLRLRKGQLECRFQSNDLVKGVQTPLKKAAKNRSACILFIVSLIAMTVLYYRLTCLLDGDDISFPDFIAAQPLVVGRCMLPESLIQANAYDGILKISDRAPFGYSSNRYPPSSGIFFCLEKSDADHYAAAAADPPERRPSCRRFCVRIE
jgi:hypothetical protein